MSRIGVTRFYVPAKVVKGIGALEQLGTEAKLLKAKNILIVTGPNLVKIGVADTIHNLLKS
ncbi:MAG: hypothetical protein ACPL7B_17475, partial [Candidatus Poribacteria bacterium]